MNTSLRLFAIGLASLSIVIFSSNSLMAQAPIPNGGFELWTGGNPDGWTTDNNGPFTPITKTADAHSGSWALRGDVALSGPVAIGPTIISGTSADPRFPYADHPTNFTGFYKFTTVAGDMAILVVSFFKSGGVTGTTSVQISTEATSYTSFSSPIQWVDSGAPDSASIVLEVINQSGQPHSGTTIYLDDLAFSNSSSVSNAILPMGLSLEQNYPNPFNPTTTIRYSLSESAPTLLNVYDMIGTKVAMLVNERQTAGQHEVLFDASRLASGVYFCRLSSGIRTVGSAMQLIK